MKYQPVTKTPQLLQLEAVLPRLNSSHPSFRSVEKQFGQDRAGYHGERNLLYHFEFIKKVQGFHLSGLRLQGSTYFFQIDHFIATPHALFIIETKNRKGRISENAHGQFLQQYGQTEITFENPKHQADIQKRQISYILKQHDYPVIPIIPLAVFPHDEVQLDLSITSPNVMVAQNVSFFINDYLKKEQRRFFSIPDLNRLKKFLQNHHTPLQVNVMEKFNIRPTDLRRGVLCPTCKNIKTQRHHSRWYCPKCQKYDRIAHINALRDYALLISPTINNRTARWWLDVESPSLITRLMSGYPVVKEVGRKAIEYNLSSLLE